MEKPKLSVHGAPWCPDCKRSKQFLGDQRVPYRWIDIDKDAKGREYVRQVNNGKQVIPTIVFEDGSILVEPSNAELARKLGINPRAERQYYDFVVLGSGPAGLTAAIYAAREGLDTLVIEKGGVGGQTGTTERIENYPGFAEGVGGARRPAQSTRRAIRRGDLAGPGRVEHHGRRGLQAGLDRDRGRVLLPGPPARHRKPVPPPERAGGGRPHRRWNTLLRDLRRAILQGPGGRSRRWWEQRP